MTDQPINLTQLRKHAERWMAYSDERGLMAEPLLALIDAAEAAHQVMNELLWGDTRTSDAYVKLGTALTKFTWTQP